MSSCSATHLDDVSKVHGAGAELHAIEPLVVKPRVAWRLLGCSSTYGYELLAAGELDSFKDGKARKITMASIRTYVARRIEAGQACHLHPRTPSTKRRRV